MALVYFQDDLGNGQRNRRWLRRHSEVGKDKGSNARMRIRTEMKEGAKRGGDQVGVPGLDGRR